MNRKRLDDLSGLSMLDLFRVEAENQTAILTAGLLELERGPVVPRQLEALMRAAHSLKGAARIVNLTVPVRLAHAMEDCFVLAQQGRISLGQNHFDVLLRGVDLLTQISKCSDADINQWETDYAREIVGFLNTLAALASAPPPPEPRSQPLNQASTVALPTSQPAPAAYATLLRRQDAPDRVVRVSAENLSLLVSLAGESLVESRWLHPFATSMQRLSRHQAEIVQALDSFRHSFREQGLPEPIQSQLNTVSEKLKRCRGLLTDGLEQLDLFDRRATALSQRLNQAVLQTRMRPFADGVRRFPRMVRDLARILGKQVRLEVVGEHTQVDRDILEKLESPLAHLLRNAVDHGCEPPDERRRAGKPAEGMLRLEARHRAGMLLITVVDDGRGVDPSLLREVIVRKKLTTPHVAEQMSELELLDFLFLPGFTMKDTVTEISGRGVGLDVVQNVVKSVRGVVRVVSQPGRGMRFQLQLPLTLSMIRTLLVEVAGEAYAIPLPQIVRTVQLPREKIEVLEGRHHFKFDDQQVGLVTAHQVFDCGDPQPPGNHLSIVVVGERVNRYGLVVDRFLGERELVVQPLDPRLGKVKDISAAALMEDGAPVLIVDVEDMIRSIEKLVARGQLTGVNTGGIPETTRKRVLAVDDSLTVRELERKLLTSRGYLADVAVDGMDGWNAVRAGHYDLVITDVDMPRLDGIELAMLIKRDPVLKTLPVMIVSYKDREEDRLRGLEAGADYYLAKGSFHDETLLQAVADLIGEPET